MILARGVGAPLDTLGVAEGMSGSPAFVDGKLVGAVSSTWSFMKQPMLGITPVEQMERESFYGAPAAQKKGARSSAAPPGDGDPSALGTSLFATSTLARLKADAPPVHAAQGFAPASTGASWTSPRVPSPRTD
jgi:hypothetical protein